MPSSNLPEVVSRDQWRRERLALLEREKTLTRERDELAADRRRLPMVEVEEDYRFHGSDGELTLLDLFEGRRQLVVYHFMFDPSWEAGCRSCTAWADHIARGHLQHLHAHDTTLCMVSRAPYEKLGAFKERMGWKMPWVSSHGGDFNYDFQVTLDPEVRPVEYNYKSAAELEELGFDPIAPGDSMELPGISCFVRDGDTVYHTYSTYARGGESVGGAYYFLDLTALGRQEPWEEPKGRAGDTPQAGGAIPYPDEVDDG